MSYMSEIEGLRILLDELKRVNDEFEAPSKLEGYQETKAAARSVYNTYFYMSPGFVADKCAAILAVCADRLTPDLRKQYQRLLKALRRAQAAALPWLGENDYIKHLQQVREEGHCVRLVALVRDSMLYQESVAVRQLTGTEGLKVPWDETRNKLKEMKNDALAVALDAFFDAMKRYRNRYREYFKDDFSDYEKRIFPDKVDKLDGWSLDKK